MRTIAFLIAGLALAAAPQLLQADEGTPSLMKVKIPAALIAKANDPKTFFVNADPALPTGQTCSLTAGTVYGRRAGYAATADTA